MSKNPTYAADGLASWHKADFLADPRFTEAYRLGASTPHNFGANLHIEWRVYVCCWAATQALRLRGDFVECGTNTGIASRAVMHYVDWAAQQRRFFLLDTFNGIPTELLTDEERARGLERNNLMYRDCLADVQATFAEFDNVVIVPGRVPDTLPFVDADRIAYLSLDMNNAVPELAAVDHFWDRLVPGAPIVLDDYGWFGHEVQHRAFDQFAKDKGVEVLALPTGQGLMFKPPEFC